MRPLRHHHACAQSAAIIFTEKLKHATLPWLGQGERRTLFYKYVPYGFHHEDQGYDVTDPGLSPRQARLLEFPREFLNSPERQYLTLS